jgi:hypothetical protein
MRAIWTQDHPAYAGRIVSFEGVQAHPHPLQRDRWSNLQRGWAGHAPVVVPGTQPNLSCLVCTGWRCKRSTLHPRLADKLLRSLIVTKTCSDHAIPCNVIA